MSRFNSAKTLKYIAFQESSQKFETQWKSTQRHLSDTAPSTDRRGPFTGGMRTGNRSCPILIGRNVASILVTRRERTSTHPGGDRRSPRLSRATARSPRVKRDISFHTNAATAGGL